MLQPSQRCLSGASPNIQTVNHARDGLHCDDTLISLYWNCFYCLVYYKLPSNTTVSTLCNRPSGAQVFCIEYHPINGSECKLFTIGVNLMDIVAVQLNKQFDNYTISWNRF